jgi:UDP-N-acetylglucosamine 1-carboxyvinyltransferase
MAKFIIEGGKALSGTVTPSGNKNEALPVLMASLITEEPITFRRVPKIADVLTVCDVLSDLGVSVKWIDEETLTLCSKGIQYKTPDRQLCSKIRGSLLLLGPMLARFGKAEIPMSGGDVIGSRRIDTHWEGLEGLGAKLQLRDGIRAEATSLKGAELFLDEPSVTATENILLLAVLCEGNTIIQNAASEPHVIGLCNLLSQMGAQIEGIGSNRLSIKGVKSLKGATHTIGPDFMEACSFLCLGAIAKGRVKIDNINPLEIRNVLRGLSRIGVRPKVGPNYLEIDGSQPLEMQKDLGGRVGTLYSGPWPAFPTDVMSVAIVAATQSVGTTIFFEKMFEGRMFFTDKLMQMGSNIVLCDPHRVVVTGKSRLFASKMSSPDVRAGMALIMAALVAEGTSVIDNIYQVERGYFNIEKKLRSLGAEIRRVD